MAGGIMISWKDGAMIYDTWITVSLKPSFCTRWPHIRMGLDDIVLYDMVLDEPRLLVYQGPLSEGEHILWLELKGKTNLDSTSDADQALIIEEIGFEGITADRFIWRGEYTPEYPEPWASQQTDLKPVLENITYMGWNGKWRLTFDAPVFTWIHAVENLGWLYL